MCQCCGNEIGKLVDKCPYCDSYEIEAEPPARPGVKVCNVERGMPTVDEACALVERHLADAARLHERAVAFIHGYGSTGKGGKLRPALRAFLQRNRRRLGIAAIHAGEDLAPGSEERQELIMRYPQAKAWLKSCPPNQGITLVLLKRA